MHRVELKVFMGLVKIITLSAFLMHRVELKELSGARYTHYNHVPNAPCGVERNPPLLGEERSWAVPNAPCGVESKIPPILSPSTQLVPNAPCGVESVANGLSQRKREGS